MTKNWHSIVQVFASCVFAAGLTQASEPTAADILDSMRRAYSNLTSYSDSGMVETTVSMAGQKQILKKPFATSFKKPNLITFEWTSSFGAINDPHVMWSNTDGTFTYNKLLNQTRKHDSLENAVSTWTGATGGSVRNVPGMLVSVSKILPFSDLANVKHEGMEAVGGVECHKVSGARRGQPITLWIGAKDFLLQKLIASTQFGDIEETHDNIKTNVAMEDASASFVPPKDAEQVDRFKYKKLKK